MTSQQAPVPPPPSYDEAVTGQPAAPASAPPQQPTVGFYPAPGADPAYPAYQSYQASPGNDPAYPPAFHPTNPGYHPVATAAPPYQVAPSPAPEEPNASAAEMGHVAGFTTATDFSEKSVRMVFIRKVYLLLGLQLLVTFGFVALFVFNEKVGDYVRSHSAVYYTSYGLFFVCFIALACCEGVRRKHPTNLIVLAVFTLCLSYMVGTISSFYDTKIVLIAFGICVGVCVAVTLFSIQTKFDFTTCGGVLFMGCIALFLFGFVAIFTYNNILTTVYAGLGALLFSVFLAFDTQLIMGGRRYEISPDEYVFAALSLYLDVIYIFLFLLRLVGGASK